MPDDTLAESTIYSTKDYDKFELVQGNRTVSASHLRTLIQSFDANPELAQTRPVLINKQFEVIDGQHRLAACRALGQPVYYMIAANLDINTARHLNATQRGWTLRQYLDSFVATGNTQYVQFAEMLEEFPIPLTAMMIYLSGHSRTHQRKSFKAGTFKLSKDKTLGRERLEMLRDFSMHVDFWSDDGLAMAFWDILRVPEYDHARMLNKLKTAQMQRQATKVDYLRELERVYNFNSGEVARTRLF
jgi:hypothetical protein